MDEPRHLIVSFASGSGGSILSNFFSFRVCVVVSSHHLANVCGVMLDRRAYACLTLPPSRLKLI